MGSWKCNLFEVYLEYCFSVCANKEKLQILLFRRNLIFICRVAKKKCFEQVEQLGCSCLTKHGILPGMIEVRRGVILLPLETFPLLTVFTAVLILMVVAHAHGLQNIMRIYVLRSGVFKL